MPNTLWQLIQAFKILSRVADPQAHWYVSVSPDCLFVCVSKELLREIEQAKLIELGWEWDEDQEAWRIYYL